MAYLMSQSVSKPQRVLKGLLTGYMKFILVSAHAGNLMKLCTIIALDKTFIIMMHSL